MTALSDFCTTIRGWLAIGSDVYPDSVVTSWIRMAEESLSRQLRTAANLQIDTGTLTENRYLLPADYREMDFVRVASGRPLRYCSRDDFYNPNTPFVDDVKNCYSFNGNYILVGPVCTNGTLIEISYYQDVPPLENDLTWVQLKYPTLFLMYCLQIASLYSVEDERAPVWQQRAEAIVLELNVEHMRSKASGSVMTKRHLRTFG